MSLLQKYLLTPYFPYSLFISLFLFHFYLIPFAYNCYSKGQNCCFLQKVDVSTAPSVAESGLTQLEIILTSVAAALAVCALAGLVSGLCLYSKYGKLRKTMRIGFVLSNYNL